MISPLYISEIMTNSVIFYEKEQEQDLMAFCKERDITFLPSEDFKHVYKVNSNNFEQMTMPENMKLHVGDEAFNLKTFEKFSENSTVKFVYQNEEIVGAFHFSDYNKNSAYVYLYAQILDFEKNLRDLLSKDHTNEDLINRFKELVETEKSERRRKLYENKVHMFEKKRELIENSKPFEHFDITELISFANNKLKLKINQELIKDLRNKIMHFKQNIQNKEGRFDSLLFDFASFDHFRTEIEEFVSSYGKIRKHL